jgi:hypothetical protein
MVRASPARQFIDAQPRYGLCRSAGGAAGWPGRCSVRAAQPREVRAHGLTDASCPSATRTEDRPGRPRTDPLAGPEDRSGLRTLQKVTHQGDRDQSRSSVLIASIRTRSTPGATAEELGWVS